ncbi:MAG: hypothetical protein WCL18_04510 [bacterium]
MGPNNRLGAVNDGLIKVTYRSAIAGMVNREPIIPAHNGIAKHKINVNILFFLSRAKNLISRVIFFVGFFVGFFIP